MFCVPTFFCRCIFGTGGCKITQQNRTNCKLCRYQVKIYDCQRERLSFSNIAKSGVIGYWRNIDGKYFQRCVETGMKPEKVEIFQDLKKIYQMNFLAKYPQSWCAEEIGKITGAVNSRFSRTYQNPSTGGCLSQQEEREGSAAGSKPQHGT